MSELRDNVRDEIAGMYESALRNGYVNEDDIRDELGDWFDEVEDCDDAMLTMWLLWFLGGLAGAAMFVVWQG